MCNLLEEKRNIEALSEKYFSNFWRNTSGSEIKSVAVKMSDMLEALKQVGDNLEEAWGNSVKEHFSKPLQVNYSNLITSANTIPIFTIVSKVLPISSLPCWLLPRRQHHSMKAFALVTKMFSPQGPLSREFTTLSSLFCCQTDICQMLTTLVSRMI